MSELVVPERRGIYEVQARSFTIGAYTLHVEPSIRSGSLKNPVITMYAFIGIREKFEARYLSTEMAVPIRKVGTIKDDRIKLLERYPGTMCEFCGERVTHLDGRWTHVQPGFHEPSPVSRSTYYPLFNLLDAFEPES